MTYFPERQIVQIANGRKAKEVPACVNGWQLAGADELSGARDASPDQRTAVATRAGRSQSRSTGEKRREDRLFCSENLIILLSPFSYFLL